jgi:hypothetical protein
VSINDKFRLSHTNDKLHGDFWSACIVFCTRKNTGHAFVRASVDHQKQAVVLKCKLSSNLTGRATQREKAKVEDYSLKAAVMHADLQANNYTCALKMVSRLRITLSEELLRLLLRIRPLVCREIRGSYLP